MPNGTHKCPNCNYLLVLLENRRKFKCPKCSKLFPQKDIEDESFRRWNQKQRELTKHNLKLESKRPKLTEEQKKQRRLDYQKTYKDKNREKLKEYHRNRGKTTERIEYNKQLYRKNLPKSRLQKRILYYRLRQKQLALQNIEFIEDSFSKHVLNDSVATFYITKYCLNKKL